MSVFHRYVAIGDSSTEGLEDAVPGARHRGWADRVAAHVAAAQSEPLLYANLAIRGRKTREIRDEQYPRALAMRPDLASVFCGTNDIIRSNCDLDGLSADIEVMQRGFRDLGATVLTLTMPDLGDIAPLARRVRPRLFAFNERVREISARTGTLVLDAALYPIASDPRLWHPDRLHANSEGHRRIAAGLAELLGVSASAGAWHAPLPPLLPPTLVQRIGAELHWWGRYLLPWLGRRITGRSSGDGITPKRPALAPVVVAGR